jgi:hypothetical protein
MAVGNRSFEKMTLPAIDETITTGRARDLCQHFGFVSLVQRIDAAQPNEFRDWIFDGASMLPDDLVARSFHIPHLIEISLKHDLKYAYGEPNNAAERLKADEEFKQDLLNDGAPPSVAEAMFKSVRLGGSGPIRTRFSWGFARR